MEISRRVRAKLAAKEPPVTEDEINECFANRSGAYLIDTREQHRTDPPTEWFIAETDYGRRLKVCFVLRNDGAIEIKTAYDPNEVESRIYYERTGK